MKYPIGTPVSAKVQIFDDEDNGELFVHAYPGDTGVIIAYLYDDDTPTIDWSAGTGLGIFDTPTSYWKVIDDVAMEF